MKEVRPRSRLQNLFDDIDREEREDRSTIVFSRIPREKLMKVNLRKEK